MNEFEHLPVGGVGVGVGQEQGNGDEEEWSRHCMQ